MRDRLIELLAKADKKCDETKQCENCVGFGQGKDCVNHLIADHLLANGVIVPPCNVGDTVYQTDGVRIYSMLVSRLIYDTSAVAFDERAIGKTIFLTPEEAEKALAERSKKWT